MISNGLGAVFQSLLSGGMSNALGASQFGTSNTLGSSQYNNSAIAAIGQQSQDAASTNLQAAHVMQQSLKDFKDHKISMGQLLDVYDQLKAAGASGGPFAPMEKVLEGASHDRAIDKTEDCDFSLSLGLHRHGDEAFAALPALPTVTSSQASTGGQISF